MITVSAPAKVHLIGEHAVVYGHPAIIAAIGRRIYIDADKSEGVILKDARFGSERRWTVDDAIATAEKAQSLWKQYQEKGNFSEFLAWTKDGGAYETYWKALLGTTLKMTEADSGLYINIKKSEIPTGSGLGSSSASAVAIAKAASEVYNRNFDLDKINEIAYECEKLIHGTPSGGDNSTSCYGGLVWFQKSQPRNTIVPLREEIPHKLENFVFAYTKQPEKTTGELIQMVRSIPEEERGPKMQEIDSMTHEMRDVLKRKDYSRMMQIMNRTNDILSSFGLSIPETEAIYKKIVSLGGAAKMCGACYGGVMLAWHEEPEKIISAIRDLGFEPFQADLAVEGVRIEN